jgi:DNA-directed RNA polymerase specialized sigma24 family protein
MTKQELPDIKGVIREIGSLQRQLDGIDSMIRPRQVADTVKGSSKYFPYMQRIFTVGGLDERDYNAQKADLSRRLKISLMRLQLQLEDASKLIDQQDDADIRMILRLKYINGLTWSEIAAEVHMSDKTARRHLNDWWAK